MDYKIKEILREIKPDILKFDKDLINEGIVDSFDIVRIVAELEEEFNIQFNIEEIESDNFKSVNNIINLVKNKIDIN